MSDRLLRFWTEFVIKNASATLIIFFSITVIAGIFAARNFQIDSDTSKLIVQDTPWRKTHDKFLEEFPQYDKTTFIVVSGTEPNKLRLVARELVEALAREKNFKSVFSPTSSPHFDENILLYMPSQNLEKVVEKLAEAQPFLTAIASDNSVRSLLTLLTDALKVEGDLESGLSQIANSLELATNRSLNPYGKPVSWRDLLLKPEGDQVFYQLIFVQGNQNFASDLPNSVIIDNIQKVIANNNSPFKNDVNIRLTGQIPLEHGEISNAMASAKLSGSIAVVILLLVLFWGIRSPRLIAAIYLSMSIGLIWTAAFAMLTVGEYNTISIIFLVMFIGLGVDFAVHLSLKYQEMNETNGQKISLLESSRAMGPALFLCGISSAIGFLAFLPTPYTGLAEMGIISAGGMFIAVFVTLTVIPAFFAVTAEPEGPSPMIFSKALGRLHKERSKETSYATIATLFILGLLATRAEFDYSTLSLKNPHSEAMITLKELHETGLVTDYTLFYAAENLSEAKQLKEKLLALDVVADVLIPEDYLPETQEENLEIIEEANFLLSSIFESETKKDELADKDFRILLEKLATAASLRLEKTPRASEEYAYIEKIRDVVIILNTASPEIRSRFSDNITVPLKNEILWLKTAFSATELEFKDLPLEQRNRLISETKKVMVSITPAINVIPVESLRLFTEDVLSIAPNVTGRPVLDLGIGDIVINSFWLAITVACSGIFLVLLFTLRSAVESVLTFIPLMMTAFFTLSISWLIDLPLNMANVVVIPLIFGLGVANGIHIVNRFHQTENLTELIHSSTPKAVFLSNLTTLASFGALCFSTHQGIYSIGVLLTVGIIALMILTIVCLPALLTTFSGPRNT